MSMLEHALEYAALGLQILPLYGINAAGRCACGNPDCKSPGKHPMTRSGVKAATDNAGLIRRWWTESPEANIGIATGLNSGVWVLDVDAKSDGFASLERAIQQIGEPGETWECATGGGGMHRYYLHPGIPVSNKVSILKGIDIRGDGGYVVAPPSVHASGMQYTWIVEPGINELGEIASSWRDRLEEMDAFKAHGTRGEGSEGREYKRAEPAPEAFPEGMRNRGLFELACSLRAKGLTDAEILPAIKAANAQRCKPPLDNDEVMSVVAQACTYARGSGSEYGYKGNDESAVQGESGASGDVFGRDRSKVPPKPKKLVTKKVTAVNPDELPETTYVWDGRLSTGLALLAGAPKIGKSWMALDLALKVARGEDFLGRRTRQGDVLYLALEDTERRFYERCDLLAESKFPETLEFCLEALPIGQGLPEAVEDWVNGVGNPVLVIVDTLGKVRSMPGRTENAYQYDTREMTALKNVADRHNICILLIHHKRKASGSGDDIYDKINGTQGIFGAMDTTMLLDGARHDVRLTEAALAITGRDVEAHSIAVKFDSGRWTIDGAREAQNVDPATAEMLVNPVVKALLAWHEKEKPLDWTGGARDLKEQLTMYGLVGTSEKAVGLALARYKFALQDEYGLIIDKLARRNRSRGWTIKDRGSDVQGMFEGFEELPDEAWPDDAPF